MVKLALYHQETYTTWNDICSTFSARKPITPRLKELAPSILRFYFDAITWHSRYNISWKKATIRMETISISTLQALSELANENLAHHKNLFFLSSLFFGSAISTILFGYDIIKDIVTYVFPGADLFGAFHEIKGILWALGVILLLFALLFLERLNSLLRAHELSSCIHVMLSLKHTSNSRENS